MNELIIILIERWFCKVYNVKIKDLRDSKSRKTEIVEPRRLFYYACAEYLDIEPQQISRLLKYDAGCLKSAKYDIKNRLKCRYEKSPYVLLFKYHEHELVRIINKFKSGYNTKISGMNSKIESGIKDLFNNLEV